MNVLPARSYNPRTAKTDRVRFLPNGLMHPAKMTPALAFDLISRYTQPGMTILDPCLGVGTTLLAMLLGRYVLGIELEPHHYRDATANASHLSRIAKSWGKGGGYSLMEGDSRVLIPSFGDSQEATITSAAFGEMNGHHRGGAITQRPNKNKEGFEGGKEFFVYDQAPRPDASLFSPAYGPQLPDGGDPARAVERIREKVEAGTLTHPEGTKVGRRTAWGGGQVKTYTTGYGLDANITSPAYEKVASRDRHLEPFAQKDPERSRKYGEDSPSRHVSGYGKNPAQIGNMKLKDNTYQEAMYQIYGECLDVTRPGGVLVTVTGNYIEGGHYRKNPDGTFFRDADNRRVYEGGKVIDLAEVTIELCIRAGWTPVERWRANKRSKQGKPSVSFWRNDHAKNGLPLIDYEDVLVFCAGAQPAWEFAKLGDWP